jgi:hypothetical protein
MPNGFEHRVRKRHIPDWVDQEGAWQTRHYRWYPYPATTVPVKTVYNGKGTYTVNGPRGLQHTVDENHRHQPPFHVADGDFGGEFYSERSGVSSVFPSSQKLFGERITGNEKVRVEYDGPLHATNPATVAIPTWTSEDLTAKGATAVARCKPTNNVASASTFLGELLREGMPSLMGIPTWKERASLARGAGSEYLNSEFGWKPLLSDVRSFAYAAANAHKILDQYERDSGKVVRRRYEFPEERTFNQQLVQVYDGHTHSPTEDALIDLNDPNRPSLYKTTRTLKRTWFSGAFTYHLPVGYKSREFLVEAAAKAGPLFGLELTPDALWNLTPWSWAVDWFSNAGDVISNLSDWAVDGLVMKYGYIMQYELQTITYSLYGGQRYLPKTVYASPIVAWREVKRRKKASPFGFGVSWNSFSPRQLAITTALGITRVF